MDSVTCAQDLCDPKSNKDLEHGALSPKPEHQEIPTGAGHISEQVQISLPKRDRAHAYKDFTLFFSKGLIHEGFCCQVHQLHLEVIQPIL